MFSHAVAGQDLSSDKDPRFEFHRWKATLRVLEIDELKTVPYTPTSHPFVERLIGTIRGEFLDQVLFWNSADLERRLSSFQHYYTLERVHSGVDGPTPFEISGGMCAQYANLHSFQWKRHCRGLYGLPATA